MNITTHQLSANDLSSAEALARILIAAWQSGFRGILSESTIQKYTQFESCVTMFCQVLSSNAGTMYLALFNGQPAGFLYWLPEGETARIEALLTIPEFWGKGVASALMERALVDTADFQGVTVWPFAENHRARRFYEKHGFSPSGLCRMGETTEVEYLHTKATV